MAKASAWIESHPEESLKVMLDNNLASFDESIMDEVLKLQDAFDWTVTGSQTEETLNDVITVYKNFELIDDTCSDEELLEKFWVPMLTDEELEKVWAEGEEYELQQ